MKLKIMFLSAAIVCGQNVGNAMEEYRREVEDVFSEIEVQTLDIGELEERFEGISKRIEGLPDVVSSDRLIDIVNSSDYTDIVGKALAIFLHISDAFQSLKRDRFVNSPIIYERYEKRDLPNFVDLYSRGRSILSAIDKKINISSDDKSEITKVCYDIFNSSETAREAFSDEEIDLLEVYFQTKMIKKAANDILAGLKGCVSWFFS